MGSSKTKISDFDLRQLNMMRDLIQRLLLRKLEVNKFIYDQWALLEMIQTIDQSWLDSFQSGVNDIDEILASFADQAVPKFSSAQEKEIDSILLSLLKKLEDLTGFQSKPVDSEE